MPSNKDLIKQAEELAEKLGEDKPKTEGLKNDDLVALVSGLREKAKATTEGAEDAAKAKVEAEEAKAEAAKKKPPFYVEKGKAITSKRGILGEGDEIKADDLAGGKEALEAFIKSGHVAKS